MEENTTTTEMQGTEATPTTEAPISMETGGVSESPKLGWVAIMMLGLTSASLIYSIFYYRKRLEALKNGDNKMIAELKRDMQEMKNKIDTLTGNKVRYGKLG